MSLSQNEIFLVYAALGLVLGLAFERGRFCFVSAFRDVHLFRNPWLLDGILVSIGAGAVGTSLLIIAMGIHPLLLGTSWYILVGAVMFGFGVSLAGACASGMVFRIPEGYVANMFELLGFSAGMLIWAEYLFIPLSKDYGAPVSIPSLLGIPAGVYGLVTGAAFLLAGLYLNRYVPRGKSGSHLSWTLDPRRSWDPRLVGLLLASVQVVMFAITPNSLLGFTAPFATLGAWVMMAAGADLKAVPWVGSDYLGLYPLMVLTIAAFVGSGIGALLGGDFRVRVPAKRRRLVQALIGGVIAGLGAGIGLGCNVGNFYTGLSLRMDLAALLFAPGMIGGILLGEKVGERL